jgi:uncharacterized protein with FMN-binding domain
MKSAPWLVAGGVVAGFLGVLGMHKAGPTNMLGASGGSAASPAATPAGAGPSATAGAAATASPGTGAAAAAGSALGAMEQYGYGELSARVTVSGGRITDVSVPVLKTAEQYSQQLASQVIPMLRSEVLAAQSAHINAVSGATYTSQAYALSVQAALDKVHFK